MSAKLIIWNFPKPPNSLKIASTSKSLLFEWTTVLVIFFFATSLNFYKWNYGNILPDTKMYIWINNVYNKRYDQNETKW